MRKVKVAVIGTGQMGSLHAHIYSRLNNVELVGLCDINKQKVKRLASRLKVKAFYNYHNLLKVTEAASIAVPTQMHYQVAREFLSSGVNILVEKPFTTEVKEARLLSSLAQKKGLILQVGHIERFNKALQVVKAIAKQPKFIECHRLSSFPHRSQDIGVVLDLMIHDLDIILELVKSKVISIEAIGVNILTPYEDIANARISFKNGCVCNLTASRVSDESMRKIRIFLKNAYISLDYFVQEASIYRKKENKIERKLIPIERDEPLTKQIQSFISCVVKKRKPIVSGEKATRALELALKIQDKIWKKRRYS